MDQSWDALALANESTVFRYWEEEKADKADVLEESNVAENYNENEDAHDDCGEENCERFRNGRMKENKDENSFPSEFSWGALASANEDSVFKYHELENDDGSDEYENSKYFRRDRKPKDRDRSRSRLRDRVIYKQALAQEICNNSDTIDARVLFRNTDISLDKAIVEEYCSKFGKILAIFRVATSIYVQFEAAEGARACVDADSTVQLGDNETEVLLAARKRDKRSGTIMANHKAYLLCNDPDTVDSRICVSITEQEVDKEMVKDYCSKFGNVVAILKSGLNFFVQFEDEKSAFKCLDAGRSPFIGDRRVALKYPKGSTKYKKGDTGENGTVLLQPLARPICTDPETFHARICIKPAVMDMDKESLVSYFQKYGKVLAIYRRQSHYVLQFEDEDSATKCIELDREVMIDNIKADVDRERVIRGPGRALLEESLTDEEREKVLQRKADCVVFVRPVPEDVAKGEINKALRCFGRVSHVEVHRFKPGGKIRNDPAFGFVRFSKPRCAAKSIEKGMFTVKGYEIMIYPGKRSSSGEARKNISQSTNIQKIISRNSGIDSNDMFKDPLTIKARVKLMPIDPDVVEIDVVRAMSCFGRVMGVRLHTKNKNVRGTSFGFVQFVDASCASASAETGTITIIGCESKITLAKLPGSAASNTGGASTIRSPVESRNVQENHFGSSYIERRQSNTLMSTMRDPTLANARIHVGNIRGNSIKEHDIENFFSNFGVVVGVMLKQVDEYKSYAFVQFSNKEGAQNCLYVRDHVFINGQHLDVNLVNSQK